MIDKSKVSKGMIATPLKVLIFGIEGVGKTSFAAGAPKPRILDLDGGSMAQDVERVRGISSFDEAIEWCEDARTDPNVETLVVDSLSRLESLVATKVLGLGDTGGLSAYGGGYGKGDDAALQHWRHFLGVCDRVSETKNVILVGHAIVKTHNDPTGLTYDRYTLALRDKAAGTIKQWVNYTLFARAEIATRVNEKSKKTIADSTGVRWIYTDSNPAYDAKHRGTLPDRLPLSWGAFADAIESDRAMSTATRAEIDAALATLGDAHLRERVVKAVSAAGTNTAQLTAILGRLRTVMSASETTEKEIEK